MVFGQDLGRCDGCAVGQVVGGIGYAVFFPEGDFIQRDVVDGVEDEIAACVFRDFGIVFTAAVGFGIPCEEMIAFVLRGGKASSILLYHKIPSNANKGSLLIVNIL